MEMVNKTIRVTCGCGATFTSHHRWWHERKSKQHLNWKTETELNSDHLEITLEPTVSSPPNKLAHVTWKARVKRKPGSDGKDLYSLSIPRGLALKMKLKAGQVLNIQADKTEEKWLWGTD